MDALTRMSYYFPANTLTTYFVVSNMIVNNQSVCADDQRVLLILVIVLFALLCFFISFTDSYMASNGMSYWVLIVPCSGPVCFNLPSEQDKDEVWEHFYLKERDYVHAFLNMTTFVLVSIFTDPTAMCLFPSGSGSSRLDGSLIRSIPLVVSVVACLFFTCLGAPRQLLGYQNVPETQKTGRRAPLLDNAAYSNDGENPEDPEFRGVTDIHDDRGLQDMNSGGGHPPTDDGQPALARTSIKYSSKDSPPQDQQFRQQYVS
jgi:hypothetical protein